MFLRRLTLLVSCLLVSSPAVAGGDDEFSQLCAQCHGKDGQGMPYVAPPLKGSAFVNTASPEEIKAMIREGRAGAAKKHPDYPAAMPPFAVSQIDDHELDELVAFLKGELQE